MIRALVIVLISALSFTTFAQFPEDQPTVGESFTQFFTRITRGGPFRGISLDAPVPFQQVFLKNIRRGIWVGQRDSARKQITDLGGDIWTDFYHTQDVSRWILPTAELQAIFKASFESQTCKLKCRAWAELSQLPFSSWTTSEREAFVVSFAIQSPLFSGRPIIDFLGDRYQMTPSEISSHFQFQLLNGKDFEIAARELGWSGPIYFRGITGPDPKNPDVQKILMNDDLMKSMTPFDAPVLQALEYVGILTHEISHVFQDRECKIMGINLEIRSAEGALLIEGSAEHQAELALKAAAATWPTVPQALNLFVAEAAVEVVYRPGNDSAGNLFPYTIGLPFAAALNEEFGNSAPLRKEIYKTIIDQQSLGEMLKVLAKIESAF